MQRQNAPLRAANSQRCVPAAVRLAGVLLCAQLIALPIGNSANADPKVVRTSNGFDVTECLRVGSCTAKGPLRLGPPAGVPKIRYTVAATLTIVSEKGCKRRPGSFAMIWRFTVPKPFEQPKVLIIYVKRGQNARPFGSAYVLK